MDARLALNQEQHTRRRGEATGTQYTDDRENTHLLVVVDECARP
ncbi:hypothetical protein [Halospeciosus flavus]